MTTYHVVGLILVIIANGVALVGIAKAIDRLTDTLKQRGVTDHGFAPSSTLR